MVKSSMLTLDWITLWILGPAIGFCTFLLIALIFINARHHFRTPQNISYLAFVGLILVFSIIQLVMAQEANLQNSVFPSLSISIIILLASIAYYIFIEYEVSESFHLLQFVIVSGISALVLATLADVGWLAFFPINKITNASGWISAIFLLAAAFFLASTTIFFQRKYKKFLFLGILPLILVPGIILNILFLGSSLITSITLWIGFFGLTTMTLFEGMVKPTAGRIEEIADLNQELLEAYSTTLEGWAKALELRDKETAGHSRRVTDLAVELAKVLGLSEKERQNVRFGALLHDIGKMAISDEILNKPGKLTTGERAIIETHPREGHKLLEDIDYLVSAAQIPLYHHEKWDGSGYPEGLGGEDIPYIARLFAIVDVWDAITSNRPYAPAWPVPMARAYLKDEKSVSFDPEIVDVFLQMEQTYKEPKDI